MRWSGKCERQSALEGAWQGAREKRGQLGHYYWVGRWINNWQHSVWEGMKGKNEGDKAGGFRTSMGVLRGWIRCKYVIVLSESSLGRKWFLQRERKLWEKLENIFLYGFALDVFNSSNKEYIAKKEKEITFKKFNRNLFSLKSLTQLPRHTRK